MKYLFINFITNIIYYYFNKNDKICTNKASEGNFLISLHSSLFEFSLFKFYKLGELS